MKSVIGITGTTSVGKSAVGVALAKMIGSEIISADSMQIYKEMDIGTAKVTEAEMRGVRHYMLDIVEPNQDYSSYIYQQQASKIIDGMDCVPIMVGGTGFYFDSLLYPPEFGIGDVNRRKELFEILDRQGLSSLQMILRELDEESYNKIDVQNSKRVIRAIEIAESGEKLSKGTGRNKTPKYDLKLFVLRRSRESLYRQINLRVDSMVRAGLVDEVKKLVSKYGICKTSAFQAIGYKEIIEYLNGTITLEDAVAKIKLNTRRYAKRQETYFKRMDIKEYIDVENKTIDEIALHIYNAINNRV